MFFKYSCAVVLVALGLAGCAGPKVASVVPVSMWQDQAFGYQSGLVTETPDSVFALDPAMAVELKASNGSHLSIEQRVDLLVSRLYDPKGIRLSYASGTTTGAAETWRSQSGNCLSLTILAYSAARHLGVSAYMQEVQVPVSFDRRNGVDFINGHVNLLVRHTHDLHVNGRAMAVENFVIDFEPQVGSNRFGQRLSEGEIMARYYNNRAAEYLVVQDDARAYAYFRAAIAASPDYSPAFANLAQLYVRKGLTAGAEQLLAHAITVGGQSFAPLQSMHKLLAAQGRTAEAQRYADLLAKQQDENPYYWMGLGLADMRDGKYKAAVRELERAAALTSGFEEVHFQLALAYWRNGQRDLAQKQLAVLRGINQQSPSVSTLSKKFSALSSKTSTY